ncbi:saccharopine dehydrogenase NADP-binding domain-containing protein [Kiloniella laminariae]|uniref:Saccharopine dehydrogenase NADP-binding domain-containing protein n=1 Tax=Kiloniella laminariae TaxID=454162 RepID=A0ABT4LDR8_9PROT|nr:saccharopine dehydrogenase NADP-binding domain-containing protein [Kiloniella laminariae]MCZ4279247.1 saccharopine dehydrogenase NADP-binding domain-containing protein [Kiloniella laminariae]
MQQPILILGGYGNFGKRIATALTNGRTAAPLPVIITGRDADKAAALVRELPPGMASFACFDAFTDLDQKLAQLKPAVVINTCGPFQDSDYSIPQCCIKHAIPYIDLADGRDFVTGITSLDAEARDNKVPVISGASTVPGLSSAVIEHFSDAFSVIENCTYGISPGQKAERGLATTRGILGYAGKILKPAVCQKIPRYGWQNIFRQDFPVLGKRWMANCDIPDLDLFPQKYAIRNLTFSAGLELAPLHLGLWILSWLVRWGLPLKLQKHAELLLRASNYFDRLGTADGGMFFRLSGQDKGGKAHIRSWYIIALDSDGPQIPTIPAIILARKLASQKCDLIGAMPCVGLVSLAEYLKELQPYKIQTYEQ